MSKQDWNEEKQLLIEVKELVVASVDTSWQGSSPRLHQTQIYILTFWVLSKIEAQPSTKYGLIIVTSLCRVFSLYFLCSLLCQVLQLIVLLPLDAFCTSGIEHNPQHVLLPEVTERCLLLDHILWSHVERLRLCRHPVELEQLNQAGGGFRREQANSNILIR